MNFHDFNIRVGEIPGSFLGQTAQNSDAQAHIAGIEHRQFLGSLINQCLFFGGMAGGAYHHAAADFSGIGEHIRNGSVMGKVNDQIRFHSTQFIKSLGNAVFTVNADPAHNFTGHQTVDQLAHGAVGTAQYRSHTCTPSFRISS